MRVWIVAISSFGSVIMTVKDRTCSPSHRGRTPYGSGGPENRRPAFGHHPLSAAPLAFLSRFTAWLNSAFSFRVLAIRSDSSAKTRRTA